MIQEVKIEEATQPKPTKKGLADYRYKPTNEMDKYPYEQILRGLRVELEGLNVLGTPTPEEYTKALSKVLKNLEKDSIFYTNQVAGIKANKKRTDLMIDATPKTVVDKENGLQKAALKEAIKGVIKNILTENADCDYDEADDISHPRGQHIETQEETEEDIYEMYSEEDENEVVGLGTDIFESVSLFDILDEGSSKHSTEWFKGYRAFNDDKELKDNPNKENPKKEDWKAGWEQAKSDEKKNN
jgi:hypothetical protein